jgi:hypothetical protein
MTFNCRFRRRIKGRIAAKWINAGRARQRRPPKGGRYKFKSNINGEALAVLTSWQVGAQQAASLPTIAGGVARIANREIGDPRSSRNLALSAVGELVGAAEVLGYFWYAEEF